MKTILKQASGTFYTAHSRWSEPVLHKSASGSQRLISATIHKGSGGGFGFFSFSWNSRKVSSKRRL